MLYLFYEEGRVDSYTAPGTESLKWVGQHVVQFSHSTKFRTECSQLLRAVSKQFVVRPLEKIDDLILKVDASPKVMFLFLG